jgi:hypothetical protein
VFKNVKIRIYKIIILPVVLYGCENWSPILKEEHRLRVFENVMLRIISRSKRDEVPGSWRKLHSVKLHNLYPSPNMRVIRTIKSRRMKLAGHVAQMGRPGMHIGYWWERQEQRDH